MADLEALETVAAFSFFSDNVEDGVDELSSLSVMTLSPVVSCSGLSEDEVIRSEELSERSSSNGVHCSWFKIHKNSSGDVSSSCCFIVVNVDSLKLEIRVTMIRTCWVDSVLVRDDLPEFGTNLVTALTTLYVNNFSH